MKKVILRYTIGLIIGTFFVMGLMSVMPNDDTIHFRVAKIYTVGESQKCYELIPSGKYNNLTRITIYGDPGIKMEIDQQVDLNIIRK